MTKATVTKLFIASLLAVAAGAIVLVVGVGAAFASDVFVTSGADVVGVQGSPLAWILIGTSIVGGLVIAGGVVAGLISWIGALLNTSQLESKTWFLVLLITGIFNFGFIAMIAYVIAGPDGTKRPAPSVAPMPA